MKRRLSQTEKENLLRSFDAEYDKARNSRPLSSYSVSSKDTVWWYCHNCKQSYPCTIAAKVCLNAKCKVCLGRPLLGDEFPILREIFLEGRNKIPLDAVRSVTAKRFWFRCNVCGDERQRSFKNVILTLRKSGKPGCGECYWRLGGVSAVMQKRVDTKLRQEGSLAENHPHLAAEWDYERNKTTPEQYLSTSGKTVHWKCRAGHRWTAPIYKRVARRLACRKCGQHISQYEKRVVCELTALGFDPEWNTRLENIECDILLRRNKVVIEVDGYPWHESPIAFERERRKERRLGKLGFTVIRWRCSYLSRRRARSAPYFHEKDNSEAIKSLFSLLIMYGSLMKSEKQTLRRYCASSSGYIAEKEFVEMHRRTATELFRRSVAETHPEIVESWSSRNGDLLPTQVTKGSKRRIWWKCADDPTHEWESRPQDRIRYGCPYCTGKKPTDGDNFYVNHKDFCDTYVCRKRNRIILTSRKTFESLWVKCVNGHAFELRLTYLNDKREADSEKSFSCPKCSAVMPFDGSPNLRKREYIKIIERFWDYRKNTVAPLYLRPKTTETFWWRCPRKHSFGKPIGEMLNLEIKSIICPKCGRSAKYPKL
jgi:very-short-patch-repair endonuclease